MINKEKFLHPVHSMRTVARNYRLHHFALAYPKSYFTLVLAAALAGYGFLLLFPLLSIVALIELVAVAQSVPFTINTLSQGLVWVGVFIFGVAISHHILTIKFELPKGVELPASKAPKLFSRLENNIEGAFWLNFFRPKFCSILLSEQFVLEIHKTPVSGIPVWSKNTLVIGFPVLQTMPEYYFECALERKLIQYSKGRNMVTNWLYQLQDIWFLYPSAFSHRKLLGEQIIVWFFKLYAPFYKRLSLYAAQQEELAADTMALREMNDSDLFKTIQSQTVAQHFFHKVYLPMVNNYIKTKSVNPTKLTPYTTLLGVFRKNIDAERCRQWLETFQRSTVNTRSIMPAFSQRMHNMGQTKIRLPELGQRSAAEIYFGAYYPKVAQHMDSVWRKKIHRHLSRRQQSPSHTPRRPNMQMKAVAS
ncbi:hypothetical protein [Kaarinaea lacus]